MSTATGNPLDPGRSLVELCVDVLVELHDAPDVEWSREDDTGPDPVDVALLLGAAESYGWDEIAELLRRWLVAHDALVQVLTELDEFHTTNHPADRFEAARCRAELRDRLGAARAARAALADATAAARAEIAAALAIARSQA